MASMRLVFPGIVPVDHVDARREVHVQSGVVAEVGQREVLDDH